MIHLSFFYNTLVLILLGITITVSAFAKQEATVIFNAEIPTVNDAKYGSYAQLATLLNQHRKRDPNTFFIFGGESLGPSLLSSMDKGSHIIDILNNLSPDAMSASKREFSFQEDELTLRSYEAVFPIVSSNLYDPLTKGAPDGLLSYAILKKGNVKLAYLSVLNSADMQKYPTNRLQIIPPKKAILDTVGAIREQGVDFIILHYASYVPFINELLDKGVVDIAIHKDHYWHLKAYKNNDLAANNIVLKNRKQAALIKLSWNKEKPKTSLITAVSRIDLSVLALEPSTQQQEEKYDARLNALLGETIGKTETDLDVYRKALRTSENGFGNYVADTLLNVTQADLALINSGGIRSDTLIPKGSTLSRKDIRNLLPYRNNVVLVEVTGQQILDALEHGLSKINASSGQYLQVSGIKVKYDSKRSAYARLVSVMLNNQPLKASKLYKLATLDYLLRGGDNYTMFNSPKELLYRDVSSPILYDIIIESIQKEVNIAPRKDGRLIDISVAP